MIIVSKLFFQELKILLDKYNIAKIFRIIYNMYNYNAYCVDLFNNYLVILDKIGGG
jgi:hypothetical protein